MLSVSFAKEVAKAQRVFIFCVGTSSVIAMDASYRFSQLGVQCYAYTEHISARNKALDKIRY